MATHEEYRNLFVERNTDIESANSSMYSKFPMLYNSFRGIYKSPFAAHRNNVHIGFTSSIILADVARKTQITFGSWPIAEFVGYSHDDAASAQNVSTLISAQMKDCRSYPKSVDVYTMGDLYGTGIARVGWSQIVRDEKWRVKQAGIDGTQVELIKEGRVTRFDGPDWEPVSPDDFGPQRGKKYIWDMDYCTHRYRLSLDRVRELEAAKVFLPGTAKQCAEGPAMLSDVSVFRERLGLTRSMGHIMDREGNKYDNVVIAHDMVGLVPDELKQGKTKWLIITMLNGHVVARVRPYPFWHGKLNFLSFCPAPDPHEFWGLGKAEMVFKMQALSNRFASQKADALELVINPMWLYNRLSGIDAQAIYSHPGRTIGVNGPVDDTQLRPVPMNLEGFMHADRELAQFWQWMQQATGIVEDTISGMPSSGRQTKAEFVGRQENVLTRQMLEAKLAEECFVEPLCDMMYSLDKQFLTVPHKLKILGSDGVVDPITGATFPQQPVTVDLEDLNTDYRARAQGATQMIGKAARRADVMQLQGLLQSNPVAVAGATWSSWFRYVFKVFDIPNYEAFLGKMPLFEGQGLQAGMSGEEAAGALGGAIGGGTPPDVLARFAGGTP